MLFLYIAFPKNYVLNAQIYFSILQGKKAKMIKLLVTNMQETSFEETSFSKKIAISEKGILNIYLKYCDFFLNNIY